MLHFHPASRHDGWVHGKPIVVTGGAGFIGSHLTDRLLEAGEQVIVVDDLSAGSRSNLILAERNPLFSFRACKVSECHDLESLLASAAMVVHLAAVVGVEQVMRSPIRTIETNLSETEVVLAAASHSGTPVLLASTSEVYGDPEVHPQPESYRGCVNPIGIRACYDEGKRCAETLFFDYHRQNQVDIRVVRIFNTYGPRMLPDDGRVVSNFIVQALQGKDLTIYGDGTQTRSFCYVDDLIEGFVRLMNHPSQTGPVNIGNPGEFTMLELAEMVLKKVGGPSKVTHLPLPGDDPKQRRPDISLAEADLGWKPKVALEDGLDPTIEYFRKLLAAS